MFWEISQNSQENTCTRVSILIKLQAQVISCACQETLKIQSDLLTSDSEKVLDQLKCKVCDEVPYVGKTKTKFRYRFNNYKSKYRAFGKGSSESSSETISHSLLSRWPSRHWRLGFCNFFSNAKHMRNWKKEKHFRNIDLKLVTP